MPRIQAAALCRVTQMAQAIPTTQTTPANTGPAQAPTAAATAPHPRAPHPRAPRPRATGTPSEARRGLLKATPARPQPESSASLSHHGVRHTITQRRITLTLSCRTCARWIQAGLPSPHLTVAPTTGTRPPTTPRGHAPPHRARKAGSRAQHRRRPRRDTSAPSLQRVAASTRRSCRRLRPPIPMRLPGRQSPCDPLPHPRLHGRPHHHPHGQTRLLEWSPSPPKPAATSRPEARS